MNSEIFLVRLREQYLDRRDDGRYRGPRLVRAFASERLAREYCDSLDQGRACPPATISPLGMFASLWEGSRRSAQIILRTPHGDDQSPWCRNVLDLASSLGEDGFCARVRELGFEPPPLPQAKDRQDRPVRAWHAFWDQFAGQATEAQRLKLWAAFDLIYFFEICSVSCEA